VILSSTLTQPTVIIYTSLASAHGLRTTVSPRNCFEKVFAKFWSPAKPNLGRFSWHLSGMLIPLFSPLTLVHRSPAKAAPSRKKVSLRMLISLIKRAVEV
jgi:hypothetical protein